MVRYSWIVPAGRRQPPQRTGVWTAQGERLAHDARCDCRSHVILPNYTLTTVGPFYSRSQSAFIAIVSLVLYGLFVLVSTVRHRDYFFLSAIYRSDAETHAAPHTKGGAREGCCCLIACLGAVVLLGSRWRQRSMRLARPPAAGIIIAAICTHA